MKQCSKCKFLKEINDFYKDKSSKDLHKSSCKSCNKIAKSSKNIKSKYDKQKKKQYYIDNKNKILENSKKYYDKVKDQEDFKLKKKIILKNWRSNNKDVNNQKIKDRKKSDTFFKLIDSIRTLIWISINKMNYKKNSKTEIILGCSFEEFKIYIESQFKSNMNWNNHGEWHLDHKIPISWAKTEQDVYKLNNYKNFQPLWKTDNLKKGNKYKDD